MSEDNNITLKAVNPTWLRDLITLFTWLDDEHQDQACSALNAILQEQMSGHRENNHSDKSEQNR